MLIGSKIPQIYLFLSGASPSLIGFEFDKMDNFDFKIFMASKREIDTWERMTGHLL